MLGFPVNMIHHEARRLPNGDLVLLTNTERFANQGDGTVDVIGDVIVVLDPNLNLVWSWNGFDHLDVSRAFDERRRLHVPRQQRLPAHLSRHSSE
jgi:hypothetical protein